jgi:GTP cyclohydrolase II
MKTLSSTFPLETGLMVARPANAAIARCQTLDGGEYLGALALARKTMEPFRKEVLIREGGMPRVVGVTRLGVGPIDTRQGAFHHFYFEVEDRWMFYHVLVKAGLDDKFDPDFANAAALLVRIDSGCQTGQVYGDRTCECREQLDLAMADLQISHGMVIHIPSQDGRGMGLPFKLATLLLQERLGLDTVEAARAIAGNANIDARSYGGAVAILKFFNIPERMPLSLITNNPKKTVSFAENGYLVEQLVPAVIAPTEHTHRHLLAKQRDLGHVGLVEAAAQEGVMQ